MSLIVTICREVCEGLSTPVPFGHGQRSAANLRDEEDNEKGAAWLYPFTIVDAPQKGGALFHTYSLLLDFLKPSPVDMTPEGLEALLLEMDKASKEFIIRLRNDSRVKEVTSSRREPVYFQFDYNLSGYAAALTVETHYEPPLTNVCG